MGSLARLPEAELRSMAAAFSALPNPVLWKLDPKDMPCGFGFIISDWLAAHLPAVHLQQHVCEGMLPTVPEYNAPYTQDRGS